MNPSRSVSQYGHAAWRIQEGYLPGLPEVVAQTADGYLWIGTYAGLVRFDGARFLPWASVSEKPLPDYRIWSLLATSDGSLWIGTQNGLARWKAGELTTYTNPHGRINSILEDHGDIWLARSQITDGGGPLCRVTGNEPRCFGEADGVPMRTAMRLAKDNSGHIWISGSEGLCQWTPQSSTTYFQKELKQHGLLLGILALVVTRNGDLWISLQQPGGSLQLEHFTEGHWKHQDLPGLSASDQVISALYEDRDGAVWVGTGRQGIYRIYQGRTDHFASSDGLTADAVAGFFQDREGILWIATSKGIDSFRDLPVISYSLKEGLSGDSVSTVLAAHDGTVWIGTSGALDSIRQGKISAIRTNAGLPGRDVTTMYEDGSGRLWLGLDSGLFALDHGMFHAIRAPNGKALGIIYSITEDTGHNIWVRAHPNQLVRVDGLQVRQVIESPEIANCFALAADPVDGIWLGLVNGDLARYRGGHMDLHPADPKVSTARIRKLLPEPDGSVVSVTEQGLVWWKDGKRAGLATQNGLPCDELYTVVKDQQGAFWFYARCGLFSIAAPRMKTWLSNTDSRVQVEMYDVFDGVQPGITPLQPQGTLARDGRLWFANDSILQTIDPRAIQRNALPPNVVIEKVVADGNRYSSNEEFRVPALTRNLEIDYTALSFVAPPKVRFRYKLEGHDSDWLDPQTRRQAFYSDLPPGKYRFHVMGSNNDGVWNEAGSSVEFSLAPAFFQTNWFLMLGTACFIAALWVVYLLRMRQVAAGIRSRMEERLGERERIARELHDTLLQSIQGLILRFDAVAKQIPKGEPIRQSIESALDRAEEAVTEGRERVLNLRATQTAANDLADAFPLLAGQAPHGSATDLKVVVEGSARPLHPWVREEVYSIGREAIVNAFRHAGAAHIEVEIIYDSRELRLRIRDDGSGMDPEILNAGGRQGHWGVKGMRERAKNIGAELQIWSGRGTGTEVDLKVPALRAYPNQVAAARWLWLRGVWGRNR